MYGFSPPNPPSCSHNDSGYRRTSPPSSPPSSPTARRRGLYAYPPPSSALPTSSMRRLVSPSPVGVIVGSGYLRPLSQSDGRNNELSQGSLPTSPLPSPLNQGAQSPLSPHAALLQSDFTTSSSNSFPSFDGVTRRIHRSVPSNPSVPTSPPPSSGRATNISMQPEAPAHSVESLWRFSSPQALGADRQAPASPNTPEVEVAHALRMALSIDGQTHMQLTPMQLLEMNAAVKILLEVAATSSTKQRDDTLSCVRSLAKGFQKAAAVLSARAHQMAPSAHMTGLGRNGMFNHSNPVLPPPGLQASDVVVSRISSPSSPPRF